MRPIIKKESHGYVKPDGNPMTGGAWFSITFLAHKEIPIESLTDAPEVLAWLKENNMRRDTILANAYIHYGYDDSTNFKCLEVVEWFDDEDFELTIQDCPLLTEEQKVDFSDTLDLLASDTDGYEAYA